MKITDFPNVQRAMKKAQLASQKSSFHKYMIGSVIVTNGKIIASGWSQAKTHPFIGYHGTYATDTGMHVAKNMHAEIASIFKVKNRDTILSGSTIYVYRQNKEGALVNARPCPMCYKMLQEYGFKKMIYTIDGGIAEEYIK